MGRPKKSPQDKRDSRVVVMLTERERAELEHRAAALGITLSEFTRRRMLGVPLPPASGRPRSAGQAGRVPASDRGQPQPDRQAHERRPPCPARASRPRGDHQHPFEDTHP